MTTVVSPGSSPSPVYNRSGVTVTSVTGGTVSGSQPVGNDGVAITHYAGVTVVLVTPPNGNGGVVVLPSSAEIGDIVEIYCVSSIGDAVVFPPINSSIGALVISTGTNSAAGSHVVAGQGRIYRLVSSTNWQGTTGGSGAGT